MYFRKALFAVVFLALVVSCSVISGQVREGSLPSMPFDSLLKGSEVYAGRTVVLGGYILGIENKAGETLVKVLQSPLVFRDEPSEKDRSEGRFVIVHKGFLDPEVYQKDRRITVAGIVSGLAEEDRDSCPNACLKIESREIHLWPEYEYRDYYPPYFDDYRFYYPPAHPYYYRYQRYPYYYYPYYPYW